MSYLSYSKNASFTFCRKSSSNGSGGDVTSAPCDAGLTVTRTLVAASPPGPLAVIEYVVDCCGCTVLVPSGATFSPASTTVVAFVDDQESCDDCPCSINVGEACSVTVGRGAGAGGVGAGAAAFGCSWWHPANVTRHSAIPSAGRKRTRFCGRILNSSLVRAGLLRLPGKSTAWSRHSITHSPRDGLQSVLKSVRSVHSSLRRPVRRLVLPLGRQLPRFAPIRQHRPDPPPARPR